MIIAVTVLLISTVSLFLFIFLKVPALVDLPEKEYRPSKLFFIKEKLFSFLGKAKEVLCLQNILRRLLSLLRYVNFKIERLIMKLLHRTKK